MLVSIRFEQAPLITKRGCRVLPFLEDFAGHDAFHALHARSLHDVVGLRGRVELTHLLLLAVHLHDVQRVRHLEVLPHVLVQRVASLFVDLLELVLSRSLDLVALGYLDLLVLHQAVDDTVLHLSGQQVQQVLINEPDFDSGRVSDHGEHRTELDTVARQILRLTTSLLVF